MANAVYPRFKQSLLTEADTNKSLDQTSSNAPFAALITTSSGYTYSASHQFYSSLTNVVGTDVAITTPTVVNGLFDGDDCHLHRGQRHRRRRDRHLPQECRRQHHLAAGAVRRHVGDWICRLHPTVVTS